MDLNQMVSQMEPSTVAAHDQVSDTLDKLAQNMDYSVGSYLLIESLRMMNEKLSKAQSQQPPVGSTDKPLVDPWAIQIEAGPSLSM